MLSLIDEQAKLLNETTLPILEGQSEVIRYQDFVCVPMPEQKLVGVVEKTEGKIYILSIPDLKIIHQMRLAKSDVKAVGVFPLKPILLIGYEDGAVQTVKLVPPSGKK